MQNINKNNELNKTNNSPVIKVDDAWFENMDLKSVYILVITLMTTVMLLQVH